MFQFIPSLYRAWFNSKLLTTLQQTSAEDLSERQATEELLTQRFSEAVTQLKRMPFSRKNNSRWLARMHSSYLYQLPWYLVIGALARAKPPRC